VLGWVPNKSLLVNMSVRCNGRYNFLHSLSRWCAAQKITNKHVMLSALTHIYMSMGALTFIQWSYVYFNLSWDHTLNCVWDCIICLNSNFILCPDVHYAAHSIVFSLSVACSFLSLFFHFFLFPFSVLQCLVRVLIYFGFLEIYQFNKNLSSNSSWIRPISLLGGYRSNLYGHWSYGYSSNLCIKCFNSSRDHTLQVASCI
jgi:hypothetical protein